MRQQQDASNNEVVNEQFRKVRSSVVEIQTRLAKHNELEENHVYKWVYVLLDEAERSVLMARITRELEKSPARLLSDFVNELETSEEKNMGDKDE